ncbi:MAG: cobalamin B12-binding domain-containing protein [Candidatus Helarchaeota archaeon]
MSENLKKLKDFIVELEKENALELAKKVIDDKQAAAKDMIDVITEALGRIGELYQEEEYYLAELVYAGDIAKTLMNYLEPLLVGNAEKDAAKKIVIGTVQGDMHDIGKNIVGTYARGAGYEVIDLGTDVSAEKFVNTVEESNARILGISCLLTATDGELNKIFAELKRKNLVDVKVVIGGAAMTEKMARDLEEKNGITTKFASDAITGIKIFNELID